MKTLREIHSRMLGPYAVPDWLGQIAGHQELAVMQARDTCHYPHKLNRDCDFYLSDDCVTYYSPTAGQFTINGITRQIVG